MSSLRKLALALIGVMALAGCGAPESGAQELDILFRALLADGQVDASFFLYGFSGYACSATNPCAQPLAAWAHVHRGCARIHTHRARRHPHRSFPGRPAAACALSPSTRHPPGDTGVSPERAAGGRARQ